MKFMAENVKINCETFNLVKDSVTVKEVAEICKKYNPKTSIKITEDQTPNHGYTLSNKKLLTTGFKFLYSLEVSISEMIRQWSYKKKSNKFPLCRFHAGEFEDQVKRKKRRDINDNNRHFTKREVNFYSKHAMLIIGYDDNKCEGAFQILNSSGEEWVDEGVIWVKYKDFFDNKYFVWEVLAGIN